jgi:hypothetical protein
MKGSTNVNLSVLLSPSTSYTLTNKVRAAADLQANG